MNIRIRNGRVIDPAQDLDAVSDLWVEDGTVAGVGRKPRGFKAAREINAKGLVVCPGLIEISAHLREPGAEHKATIASELAAAASGGFTAVCATPDTDPVVDTPAVVELIHQRARGVRGARVHCIGALTRELEGEILAEMQALKDIGCVAVSNANNPVRDTSVLKSALAYASTLNLTVVLQPADPWLSAKGVMHEGAQSTRLGLPGIPAAAELIGLTRDLMLIAATGVKAHFHTLSTGAAVPYITSARADGLAVTADVGLAHLCLTDSAVSNYSGAANVQPPLRSQRDRQQLVAALKRGDIDALSAHHQPQDADAKAAPFAAAAPGISGFDTFIPLLLDVVRRGRVPLSRALAACTQAPAAALGLQGGTLVKGERADICIFDPSHEWILNAATAFSCGLNTPFFGHTLHGRVTHTLVGGRVVYELER